MPYANSSVVITSDSSIAYRDNTGSCFTSSRLDIADVETLGVVDLMGVYATAPLTKKFHEHSDSQ